MFSNINFIIYIVLVNILLYFLFNFALIKVFPQLGENKFFIHLISIIISIAIFILIDLLIRKYLPNLYNSIMWNKSIRRKEIQINLITIFGAILIASLITFLIPDIDKDNYASLTSANLNKYSINPLWIIKYSSVILAVYIKVIATLSTIGIIIVSLYNLFLIEKKNFSHLIQQKKYIPATVLISSILTINYATFKKEPVETAFIVLLLTTVPLIIYTLYLVKQNKIHQVKTTQPKTNPAPQNTDSTFGKIE